MTRIFTLEDFLSILVEVKGSIGLLQEAVDKIKVNSESVDRWFCINELIEYLPGRPSKSTIYQKVSRREIPHYKNETSKNLSFLKSEIDDWIRSGKVKTNSELEADVDQVLATKKATL